jgi:hypothetical protein
MAMSSRYADGDAREARRAFDAAMKTVRDPRRDDSDEGERRMAREVALAARRLVRDGLDGAQRRLLARALTALRGIIEEDREKDDGPGYMEPAAVLLLAAALGDCGRGYAWVDGAGLDLGAELVDEATRLDGALPEEPRCGIMTAQT